MRNYELADKAGRTKNWRSYDCDKTVYGHPLPSGTIRVIMHYSTEMLSFVIDENGKWDGNLETVDFSTGHGSVSDQQTMNQLFA